MKSVAICVGLLLAWSSAAVAQQHAPVEKAVKQTPAEQLQQALGQDAKILVIDVRSAQEFATGHIPGAVNIPLDELAKKLEAMKVTEGHDARHHVRAWRPELARRRRASKARIPDRFFLHARLMEEMRLQN